jgi:hypothetical protein
VPTLSRTVVAAPPATIPSHSLIRAALTNRDADPGWERGLAYAPETPGGYVAYLPCSAEAFTDYAAGPATPVVDYLPWELQVEHPCHSTFGYTRQAVDDELRRAIDATESFAIARELMAGDLARAARTAGDLDDGQNLALTDDPTVGWIYATGTVVVRRSTAFADGDEVETLDTATNTLTRRTSKRVAATFDRAALFAVPVTLT